MMINMLVDSILILVKCKSKTGEKNNNKYAVQVLSSPGQRWADTFVTESA